MNLIPRKTNRTTQDPFDALVDIQREMNDLFDFSLGRWTQRQLGLLEGVWSPAVDIYDSKDSLLVRVDLPGLKKEDIDVAVHEDKLLLRGEKKAENEKKGKDFVRTERFYGSFYREIALPSAVDDAKVKAAYKDGVLELTLPKKEEAKPKQIQIDVN